MSELDDHLDNYGRPGMEEEDERIFAWEQIAKHPWFSECYESEEPLLTSVLRKLDRSIPTETARDDKPMQAEEPVEWRLLRAFENGYVEGLRRGAAGVRFDHS